MRKHTQRFFLTGILAIIILAVRPLVGLAFGDTSTTQPASYSFISIDIPNASGQLGFTHLADINDGGEITGGFTNSSGFGFLLDKFRSTDIQCPGPANALPAQPQSINKQGAITGFCFTSRVSGFFRNKKVKSLFWIFLVPILPKQSGLMMMVRSLAIIETPVESFMVFFGMMAPFSQSTYRFLRLHRLLPTESTMLARL